MTDDQRARSAALSIVRSPITVWAAFVAVHLWLGLANLYAPGLPLGDVTLVYKFWIDQATVAQFWVGIDTVWVYPIVALVPMLLAAAFGPDQYASTWLTMVMLLNAVAFGFVTGWGRSRERIGVAWWWVAFLLVLGPIALGRIDSITIPLAIVGVLLIASRPAAAAAVLTIATWIKVWPAALVAAALIALRDRVRILVVGAVVSAWIVVVALALGSGSNVFSFVTQQTGRGLQIEAPISTPWMWQAMAGVPGSYIYYDQSILTFQMHGEGVGVASAIMTPLLLLAVVAVALLGVRATRRGVPAGDLFPALALALVTTFIAFNKVGSPQFIGWLAVPVILGLATSAAGHGRPFRTPAIMVLAIAALTQFIYPYLYAWLLAASPVLVFALTARNILLFVLLGWAIHAVVTAPVPRDDDPVEEVWLPSVWPLAPERGIVEEPVSSKES